MKRFNDLIMLDDRVGRTVQRGVKREPEVQVDAAYVEGYFAHGKEAKVRRREIFTAQSVDASAQPQLKVAELKSYAAKSKISLDPKARKDELIEEIRVRSWNDDSYGSADTCLSLTLPRFWKIAGLKRSPRSIDA